MRVTILKTKLRDILIENMRKHSEEVENATRGWAEQLATAQEALAASIEKGPAELEHAGKRVGQIAHDRPRGHVEDYQRVIGMLEKHLEDRFVLEENEYDQFVGDNWNWKQAFGVSNARYNRS